MKTVVDFSISYTQFLDQNSQISPDAPKESIRPKELIKIYQLMRLTRIFDQKAINLQRTGQLGTYPSSLGQEAIGAAIGYSMNPEDVFCPYYRDHATQIHRGVSLKEILLYWGGNEIGNHFENNQEDFPCSVPIASQCLHAAGVATAFQIRNQPRVAVVTCGDGATSEGDFYEALNIAGTWNLPIVFIINNNQWAISVSRKNQTRCQTLAQKAIAGGFVGEQVDGNDIIALNYQIKQAIKKARNNQGPSLIEALTYRLSDHTTADDATRYRNTEELEKAKKLDPIHRLLKYLSQNNHWTNEQEENLIQNLTKQVEQSVEDYLNTPKQDLNSIFNYQYA